MALIEEVFRARSRGPLERALKLAVVARAETVSTYTGSDGLEKSKLTVAASDGVTVIKCEIYDAAKFAKFEVGSTLSVRNSIRKMENNEKSLVLTKTSKVFKTQNIQTPEGHVLAGQNLVNPPPAEVKPIQQALRSPLKQCVSVAGRIIQEEGLRTVNVKGKDAIIKSIVVEDASGRAKVSLWRKSSETEARTGQYVTITDVVVNQYKGETSLSTTSKSNVVPSEEPLQTRKVHVTGISVEDENAELLLDTEEVLSVSSELLLGSLPESMEERNLEELTVNGNITLNIEHRGTEVQTIKFLQ